MVSLIKQQFEFWRMIQKWHQNKLHKLLIIKDLYFWSDSVMIRQHETDGRPSDWQTATMLSKCRRPPQRQQTNNTPLTTLRWARSLLFSFNRRRFWNINECLKKPMVKTSAARFLALPSCQPTPTSVCNLIGSSARTSILDSILRWM